MISCGSDHTAILDDEGKLYIFGRNNYGQIKSKYLDNKDLECKTASHISCGNNFTSIIFEDEVHIFGLNNKGQCDVSQLCINDGVKSPVQIECGGHHTSIL